MYETYYNLNEKPFNITPDPKFLYLGQHYTEALAQLIYGVQEKKGLIVLTGEVGTGKTTLIRALLENLDDSVQTALILNPNLSLRELFFSILKEFDLRTEFQNKADFLALLNDFLLERLKNNESAVIIVDEAQNLSTMVLEEIRLLLNLETSKHKLLHVILTGQPELIHKLDLPQLRQFKQRIALRYNIPSLTKDETKGYIKKRLIMAGSQDISFFTDKAIKEVYKYTKGIPRLINIVCDNSLLTGYATNQTKIFPKIVKECVKDLRLGNTTKRLKIFSGRF